MLTYPKDILKFNHAVKNMDLSEILTANPSKEIPKFPKMKKLFRTLSLARELRNLNKDYFYFNENAIALEFFFGPNYKKKTVCIVANERLYRVRVDLWLFDKSGGHFYYKEIEQPSGNRLLWELVCFEILDNTFLPRITKHHELINDL